MKIKNLTVIFMFAFYVGCGAAEDTFRFTELGSAQAELEKCYEVRSVPSCNFDAQIYADQIRTSIVFEDSCKDIQKAVKIACSTQFSKHAPALPAKQIVSFHDDCSNHYQAQVEKACVKPKNQQ